MKVSYKILVLMAILLPLNVLSAWAQEEYSYTKKGNKQYKKEQYTEAEISYRRALEKNQQSAEATYNLGNALFRQEKYPEALEQYQQVIPNEKISKKQLASALHNTGNALLMQQKIPESIEAYKNSLRINPKDDETRYNLALAQYLLKQQEEQENQDNQEDKQEQQEEQQKEQDDSQQQEEQQESMPKDRAEQLLDALMQDEDETMEKAQKMPPQSKRAVEKNW